jgi:hypothetical protein
MCAVGVACAKGAVVGVCNSIDSLESITVSVWEGARDELVGIGVRRSSSTGVDTDICFNDTEPDLDDPIKPPTPLSFESRNAM